MLEEVAFLAEESDTLTLDFNPWWTESNHKHDVSLFNSLTAIYVMQGELLCFYNLNTEYFGYKIFILELSCLF